MTCRRSQVRVLYRAPRVCDILDVTDSFFVVSPRTGKTDVESEIRRGGVPSQRRCPAWNFLPLSKTRSVGAHYICARGSLPYRKRARADMESAPTFFVAGGGPSQRRCPARRFLPLSKTRSVGAHSICARGSLSYRKRARADMESAPTFFCSGRVPSQRRCPAWSCLPLLKARSVGAHSICARGGLSCRKQARADMESAPTFFCGGRSPRAEAAPRVEFSPFVESEIRRGAFYMRPRRFILPQAGTGGYGIRPYVFCSGRVPSQRRCPAWSFLPLSETRSAGAHSICARGGLSYRKRARADMESAPTFLWRAPPRRGGQERARFCLLCVQADLFPLSPCQKPSYVVYYFSTSPQANPVQTGDAKL